MGYHTQAQCSIGCDHLCAAYCVYVSHFFHPELNKNKNTCTHRHVKRQLLPLIIRVVWLNTVIFNGVVCFVLDHFTQCVFEDGDAAGWG